MTNPIDNASDTAAAIAAGRALVDAKTRVTWLTHPTDSRISVPLLIDGDGNPAPLIDVITLLDQRYVDRPRAGTTHLTEVDSLIAYVKRWGSDASVIYADTAALSFSAVLDDHPPDSGTTAARTHRAAYACPRSSEWQAWSAIDGKPQGQTQFADFLESRLEDMVGGEGYPVPTAVLQVARSLNILTKGTFQREINPTNGDSIFVAKTETDSKSTQIPRAFLIAIPVFDAGERYQVEVRVRFALVTGGPQFVVTMHRRAEIERDAFAAVRAKVAKDTGRIVLAGTP